MMLIPSVVEIKVDPPQLPECKECRTCGYCRKNKKLPKITWEKGYPLIFCTYHHEHFALNDICEFWKEEKYI